jgi:fumarylpyruvate hydrolase
MKYAIPAPPTYTLTIAGSDELFPVHRVFCVGRNYAAHAREMGKDPDRDPPFFFMKPACAVVAANETAIDIPYPPMTANFHHEIELVVTIGKGGKDIPASQALEHVHGYAVGLDMTRRDLQLTARDKGRPWDLGKDIEHGSVVSEVVPMAGTVLEQGEIALSVNGVLRQKSNISALIWNIRELIADLSLFYHLEPGDLIFTGTPEGVGPVVAGDTVAGHVTGVGEISLAVAVSDS